MQIAPFGTEHFFARYEFTTPYQLCNSDCETLTVHDLLTLAGVSPDELGELSLGYTESLGHPQLRRMIAEMYDQVTSDAVVVLGTPVEGIYLAARAALDQYLHPLNGGLDGAGWPFGRRPRTSDIQAVLAAVPGVRFVRHLAVTCSPLLPSAEYLGVDRDIALDELSTREAAGALVASGAHALTLVAASEDAR